MSIYRKYERMKARQAKTKERLALIKQGKIRTDNGIVKIDENQRQKPWS